MNRLEKVIICTNCEIHLKQSQTDENVRYCPRCMTSITFVPKSYIAPGETEALTEMPSTPKIKYDISELSGIIDKPHPTGHHKGFEGADEELTIKQKVERFEKTKKAFSYFALPPLPPLSKEIKEEIKEVYKKLQDDYFGDKVSINGDPLTKKQLKELKERITKDLMPDKNPVEKRFQSIFHKGKRRKT